MGYKFNKKNAYKEFNLHDCYFSKLSKFDGGIIINFPDGIGIDAENQTGDAIISINTELDNMNFIIGKTRRILCSNKIINISRFFSLENIRKKLYKKEWRFEIIEEYYSESRLLWRGDIFLMKKDKRKQKGYFEFSCYFEEGINIIYSFNNFAKT